jgi:hypothetical protein
MEFVWQQKRQAEKILVLSSNIKTEACNGTIKRVCLKLTGAVWDAEPRSLPDTIDVVIPWLEQNEDSRDNRKS